MKALFNLNKKFYGGLLMAAAAAVAVYSQAAQGPAPAKTPNVSHQGISPQYTSPQYTSPQYNAEQEVFENKGGVQPYVEDASPFETFKKFFFLDNDRRPDVRLPETEFDLSQLDNKSEAVRFVWLGHSTLLLEMAGKRILIDPILSNYASPVPFTVKRFQKPVLTVDQIQDVDLVVISHDHYDHLDKSTIKALGKRNIHFVVPLGVGGGHLRGWGIDDSKITELDWWQSYQVAELEIVATPAQHFSGRSLFDGNHTLWASWSFLGQQERVYFSGDSGYSSHYKEIGDRLGPFDLTFLENGAYSETWPAVHQLPEQAVQAHQDLRGKVMMPVHWGMFSLGFHPWYEPAMRVNLAAHNAGVPLLMPKLGQLVDLNAPDFDKGHWLELTTAAYEKRRIVNQ